MQVAHAVAFEEGVFVGPEETAVVRGNAQGCVAGVDDMPLLVELLPKARHAGRGGYVVVQITNDARLEGFQAIAFGVKAILAHRQQITRFSIQHEEQPVEHNQAVIVDLDQCLRRRPQAVGWQIQEALAEVAQRIVDLRFEVLANPLLVGLALGQHQVEPCGRGRRVRARHERIAAEEEPEVLERLDIALLDERGQVHLVVHVQLLRRVLVIQAPEPAVGQDSPGQPAVANVGVDLEAGVLMERADRFGRGAIQRAIPRLGVAHRQRALEIGFGQHPTPGRLPRRLVGVENIVRHLGAERRLHADLDVLAVAQRLQHRADPVGLGLCLVIPLRPILAPERGHRGKRRAPSTSRHSCRSQARRSR